MVECLPSMPEALGSIPSNYVKPLGVAVQGCSSRISAVEALGLEFKAALG